MRIYGKKLQTVQSFRGNWVTYKLQYRRSCSIFGGPYECNETHKSADNNHPGDNGSGFYYWDVVVETPDLQV